MRTRLAQLRKEANISAEALGARLNLSKSAIYSYEKGVHQMPYDVLLLLAEIFDCSVDYLLGNTNIRNQKIISHENEFKQELYDLTKDFTESQKRCIINIIKELKDHFS